MTHYRDCGMNLCPDCGQIPSKCPCPEPVCPDCNQLTDECLCAEWAAWDAAADDRENNIYDRRGDRCPP